MTESSERPEIEARIVESVIVLARLLEHLLSNYIGTDMSFNQFLLLAAVEGFRPDAPKMTEVAEKMLLTHQSVKKLARQLEKRGFLELKQDDDDRRVFRLVLTEHNTRYWANRDAQDTEKSALLFGDMPDQDLQQLDDGLRELLDRAAVLRKQAH